MNIADRLDREAIEQAPHLRVISDFGVGYDNVDVAAATERGIIVCNTPGVVVECTADHTFALLLAVARRLPEAQRSIGEGRWRDWLIKSMVGQELYGATLGIIGLGNIGQAVARRARGFSMRILYAGRSRKPDAETALGAEWASRDDLLKESDFVAIHTPLTDETRGMIGARELGLMKPTAILVNTARGAIVVQRALYDALRDRQIYGAGLDVTDPEPMEPNDPFLSLPNAIVVPHIASAGARTRARMSELAAQNLIDGLAGRRPRHLVNPDVWDRRKSS